MNLRPTLAVAMMLVTVILALTAGAIRYVDLEAEVVRLTRELHHARQSPMCRPGEYLSLTAASEWRCQPAEQVIADSLDEMRADIARDQEDRAREIMRGDGDLTGLRVTPEPPEPSQAQLEARQGVTMSLHWDPLRRCVPGIPATRWLTSHGDGVFEWPAGIGCGQ